MKSPWVGWGSRHNSPCLPLRFPITIRRIPMSADRIHSTYRIETAHPLEEAAAVMAGEQSSGTFIAVPGETDALRERFGARIESIHEEDRVDAPSLPGSRQPAGRSLRRALVTLSFPVDNIGPSLPNLMTMVAGNLFELSPFSGMRLLDIELPDSFAREFPGPAFGISGTRKLAGVSDRPILGTIVKPSVGLSPDETASLARTLAEAGLDFIKDDELIANPPYSPLKERVRCVMRILRDHADRTGKLVMYAFNITDEPDAMLRHHDTVREAGGSCVMVSMISAGLSAVAHLRRHASLPIHGHRNGWGMLARHPLAGMEYAAFQKLFRLAGADHFHVNGLRNKFCEEDASVIRSAQTCLQPFAGTPPVMPVFSSGQSASQAPDTYAALQSVDLMYICGGGILGHPDGVAAGVQSLREAWEAAVAGVPLETYARERPALARALQTFQRT